MRVRHMKIRETLNNTSSVLGVQGKDERKVSESREASFKSQLKRFEDDSCEERIKELAGRIAQQSDRLAKRMDISELMVYKRLISEFMEEALGHSRRFSKQGFLDRRGRHRVYAVIKKVNEELDQLTRDVLSEEKDNIKVLQRLDDIRGLILDIVM